MDDEQNKDVDILPRPEPIGESQELEQNSNRQEPDKTSRALNVVKHILDTDTKPLQPMETSESDHSQQMADLKEENITSPTDGIAHSITHLCINRTTSNDEIREPNDDTASNDNITAIFEQQIVNRERVCDVRQPRAELNHQLPIVMPPLCWEYNKLLEDMNKMITPDELKSLTHRFKKILFGKRTLEWIKQPRELFTKMEEGNFLNENQIVYLQAILRDLGRPELMEKLREYGSRTDTIIHLQQAEGPAEEGYTFVEFHLYLDKEYTGHHLATLQMWMARILCLDVKDVFIAGVEPSNSLKVTFMLRDTYVDLLVKCIKQNLLQDRLAALGVDTITIDAKIYEIVKAGHGRSSRSSDEQLASLYHQLADRDHQIAVLDDKCSQLELELRLIKIQEEVETPQLSESKDVNTKCQRLHRRRDIIFSTRFGFYCTPYIAQATTRLITEYFTFVIGRIRFV